MLGVRRRLAHRARRDRPGRALSSPHTHSQIVPVHRWGGLMILSVRATRRSLGRERSRPQRAHPDAAFVPVQCVHTGGIDALRCATVQIEPGHPAEGLAASGTMRRVGPAPPGRTPAARERASIRVDGLHADRIPGPNLCVKHMYDVDRKAVSKRVAGQCSVYVNRVRIARVR